MSKTKKLGNKPLFSKKELAEQAAKEAKAGNWKDRQPLEEAFKLVKIRRAQERADEFLNGLLSVVGSRGEKYVTFDWAFNYKAAPDAAEVVEVIAKNDNPEARRDLYTILRALTEIPKTWGASAVVRFFRGTGKQKNARYHGAGMFSSAYGWKERELKVVVDKIVGDRWYGNAYSQVLMQYEDMYNEISEAASEDYSIDVDARNYAVNCSRDVEFINKLCDLLEKRGLGPVPTPAAAKPKKDRKVKEFKSGDIIRRSNMRDLPLPAHVRLNIQKYDKDSKQWLDDTLEQVVIGLGSGVYYERYIMPGTDRAYPTNVRYDFGISKDRLEGAVYLGPWKGKIVKTKDIKLNFSWKKRPD